jgi:hypothetical protein
LSYLACRNAQARQFKRMRTLVRDGCSEWLGSYGRTQRSRVKKLGHTLGRGQTLGRADDQAQSGGQPCQALQLVCTRGGVRLQKATAATTASFA